MRAGGLKPAFVLHRRRYGDSSLLVDLFTESQGRVVVIAKGALSGRGARASMLQPFIPLLCDWRGRGEVHTLTVVEPAGAGVSLKGKALYCGLYLNELLVRLSHRQDSQLLLFARYAQTLSALAEGGDPDPVLRRFELVLLQSLGTAADLSHETDGTTPVCAEGRYRLAPEAGPIRVGDQDPNSVQGETLLRLAEDLDLPDPYRREARQLLRGILAFHLGGRPLKSRELFKTMQLETR